MKLIVIVKTNSYVLHIFLVTNTFRCVIGEFHHKIRFVLISADIQSTTFKLCLKSQKKWQSNLKHTLLKFGPKFQSHISVVGPQFVLHKIIAVTYDSKFKRLKRARRTWKYPTHLFVHTIMKFFFVTLSDLREESSTYVHVNI